MHVYRTRERLNTDYSNRPLYRYKFGYNYILLLVSTGVIHVIDASIGLPRQEDASRAASVHQDRVFWLWTLSTLIGAEPRRDTQLPVYICQTALGKRVYFETNPDDEGAVEDDVDDDELSLGVQCVPFSFAGEVQFPVIHQKQAE